MQANEGACRQRERRRRTPITLAAADVSPEFSHLVARLLDKSPASRMGWRELSAHAFWGGQTLPLREVPSEPALAAFLAGGSSPSRVRAGGGRGLVGLFS